MVWGWTPFCAPSAPVESLLLGPLSSQSLDYLSFLMSFLHYLNLNCAYGDVSNPDPLEHLHFSVRSEIMTIFLYSGTLENKTESLLTSRI